MAGTLRDAKVGDQVISNVWTSFIYGSEPSGDSKYVPRELIVVEMPEGKDCVWCQPADGITTERIPLWAGLICRVA